MTKHTITIVLDITDGMEASVARAAYMAQEAIGNQSRDEAHALVDAALLIHNASLHERPQEVQAVIDSLRAQAQLCQHAYTILSMALSEISHAMSEADSQWRRSQTAPAASE